MEVGIFNPTFSIVSTALASALAFAAIPSRLLGGEEVMNLDDDGSGSLRQAIADVNAGGTITFSPGLSGGTITLEGQELTIDKNLTIDASALAVPITIDGDQTNDGFTNDDSRIFCVEDGTTVVLDSLTLTGGYQTTENIGSVAIDSDTYLCGGAIFNLGSLTIRNCRFFENRAGDATSKVGPTGDGGAIFNAGGELVIENCEFTRNRAGDGSGASFEVALNTDWDGGNGGAIFSKDGSMSIAESLFDQNECGNGNGPGNFASPEASNSAGGNGGAIYHRDSLFVTNTTFSENRAGNGSLTGINIPGYGGVGGAVCSVGSGVLIACTIQSNRAGDGGVFESSGVLSGARGGSGGGVFGGGLSATTLVNCTVVGNEAGDAGFSDSVSPAFETGGDGGNGGGVDGSLVVHCTVTGNSAGAASIGTSTSGTNGGGGGVSFCPVSHSIIAENLSGTGTITIPGAGPDVNNCSFIGPNLIGDNDSEEGDVPVQLPLVGDSDTLADPLLGPLQNNGGSTETREPLPGSPVIDAGDLSQFPMDQPDLNDNNDTSENLPVPLDQRGLQRTAGIASDLGSVELGATTPPVTGPPPAMSNSPNAAIQAALTSKVAKLKRKAKKAKQKRKKAKSKRLRKKIRKLLARIRRL